MTTTHTVPMDVFDVLAEGGGNTLGVLHAGQRSKRLLLLHELASTASRLTRPTFVAADAAGAFAVLAEMQRRAPHEIDRFLLQPHVGAWATSCLRSLLSTGDLAPDDIGHVGALAAAAALRAGEAFEVTVYVRDGSVMFPTFGTARLDLADGWCQVRSRPGAGGIEVSRGDTTRALSFEASTGADVMWQPLRRLCSSVDGVTLDVQLDDLNPYRGCGHLPVTPRLDGSAVVDWQAKLDEAWSLLVRHHRRRAEAIADGVATIVPLRRSDPRTELSASCHEAIGAVAMTTPQQPLAFALALVHEFEHTKLSALLDLVPLLDRPTGAPFYAPWRPDPRPLRGLIHGAYAHLGLAMFWEAHRRRLGPYDEPVDDPRAHFEFAMWRNQVGTALDTLAASGHLRPLGVRFVEGMRRSVAALKRRSIPPLPRSLAEMACIDHETSWRLRNLQPDGDQVADLADEWISGRPCPPLGPFRAEPVAGSRGPIPSSARLALIRQRLAAPERWREQSDEATEADAALVAGDLPRAAKLYRAQLAEAPDDQASWAGLAVAHHQQGNPAMTALTAYPEILYALHREIRARSGRQVEAEALAGWTSGCPR